MSTLDNMFEEREVVREAARWWWLFLLAGIAWLVFALVIFRFDITSAASIAILFGIVAIVAGVDEFMAIGVSTTGWKIVHGILGVIFILVGIFAFIEPGTTFEALAAVIGFFFLFKGIFDIAVAIATKDEFELWWIQLVVGLIEIGLAFWVSGSFREKVVLLLVYVGIVALSKGITNIMLAFKLRSLGRASPRPDRTDREGWAAGPLSRPGFAAGAPGTAGDVPSPCIGSTLMRRAALVLALGLALFALAAAGCGGEEETSPTPETIEGTLTTETTDDDRDDGHDRDRDDGRDQHGDHRRHGDGDRDGDGLDRRW